MSPATFIRTRLAAGRIAGVAVLLGLLLGLGALASSSALHLKFCPNANKANHHCAVTAFAGGLAGTSPAQALALVICLVVPAAPRWAESVHRAAALFRLAPARPPPPAARLGC
jgi:hypothetical protein